MKLFIWSILFILVLNSVTATNNIYEFDEYGDIIITTSVFKDGQPYQNATCNLTIFQPPPLENFIKLSTIMINKGNGIYSINLTGQLEYSNEIYPITLYCNDSNVTFAQDDRIGVKIGVRLYDFIIPGAILITIAYLLISISFKIEEQDKNWLKMLMFYLGISFIVASLFYGLAVVNQIPVNTGFKLIFNTLIWIFIIIITIMVFLQWVGKLEEALKWITGTK